MLFRSGYVPIDVTTNIYIGTNGAQSNLSATITYCPDNIHLNDLGQAIAFTNIWSVVQTVQ